MNAVEAQVAAYNARDLERFLACYAPDVVIRDGGGTVLVEGIEAMRAEFGHLFEAAPALHADVLTRISVGPYVVLEERIEGHGGAPIRGVMVYHLSGREIDRAIWLSESS